MSVTLGNISRSQFTQQAQRSFQVAIAAAHQSFSPANVHILFYGRRTISIDFEVLLPSSDAVHAQSLAQILNTYLVKSGSGGFLTRFNSESGLRVSRISVSPPSLVRASPKARAQNASSS